MITKTQNKKLRKVLGTRYSKRMQNFLNTQNVFNKKGLPFSLAYLSHVFNGRNSDVKVEKAFFDFYEMIKQEQLKTNVERKSILNKKPKADTLGSE